MMQLLGSGQLSSHSHTVQNIVATKGSTCQQATYCMDCRLVQTCQCMLHAHKSVKYKDQAVLLRTCCNHAQHSGFWLIQRPLGIDADAI